MIVDRKTEEDDIYATRIATDNEKKHHTFRVIIFGKFTKYQNQLKPYFTNFG